MSAATMEDLDGETQILNFAPPEPRGLGPLGLAPKFFNVSEQVNALANEKLEYVIQRQIHIDGRSERLARILRVEFLRFFALSFVTERIISPSAFVDEFWHAFILHTQLYEQFCTTHRGRFFHHEPQDHTRQDQPDATPGVFTKELIAEMFPTCNSKVWEVPAICSRQHCNRACRRPSDID